MYLGLIFSELVLLDSVFTCLAKFVYMPKKSLTIYMHIHTCMHMQTHTQHTHTYMYIYTQTHTQKHTYMYAYICTHTETHAHNTYTHIFCISYFSCCLTNLTIPDRRNLRKSSFG